MAWGMSLYALGIASQSLASELFAGREWSQEKEETLRKALVFPDFWGVDTLPQGTWQVSLPETTLAYGVNSKWTVGLNALWTLENAWKRRFPAYVVATRYRFLTSRTALGSLSLMAAQGVWEWLSPLVPARDPGLRSRTLWYAVGQTYALPGNQRSEWLLGAWYWVSRDLFLQSLKFFRSDFLVKVGWRAEVFPCWTLMAVSLFSVVSSQVFRASWQEGFLNRAPHVFRAQLGVRWRPQSWQQWSLDWVQLRKPLLPYQMEAFREFPLSSFPWLSWECLL